MKSFMHLFVAVLSVAMFTACGKSSQEKAKDNADSAITELKSSATELSGMGVPSETWSDEKLTRYEALITSCESSANRIEAQNGRDGVVVYGTYSLPQFRSALSTLREAAASARSKKVQLEKSKKKDDQIAVAQAKYNGHVIAIGKAGTPTTQWSTEQLDEYETNLTGIETSATEMQALSGESRSRLDELLKSSKALREELQTVRTAKGAKPAA